MYFHLFKNLFTKLEEVGDSQIQWHYRDNAGMSIAMAEASG